MGVEGILHLLLALPCFVSFVVGFIFGSFDIGKLTRMVSLGILGGLSICLMSDLLYSGW